jgi:hypothetical protein
LRSGPRRSLVGLVQEQDELVAASAVKPADELAGVQQADDCKRDRADQLIPVFVTDILVHRLEAVEVDASERERLSAREPFIECAEQERAAGHAGDIVTLGLLSLAHLPQRERGEARKPLCICRLPALECTRAHPVQTHDTKWLLARASISS